MPVQVEELEPCKVALHIEVEADRVKQVREKAFKEVAPYVNVPGFRKGKAPRNLIQRYMNQDLLRQHTLQLLIPKAVDEAVKESGLEVYEEPEIDEEPELNPDEPLKFTATLTTPPKVELGDITGLRIEYPPLELRDEDVEAQLNGLREQRATLRGVERPAEEGDFVSIDYTVRVEGEEDQNGPMLRIAGSTEDPLDQAVLGKSAGDTFTVEAPLHTNAEGEEKTGTYEITVKEVRNWVVPELDDEFAKTLGMEGIDELRGKVRERLQEQVDSMVRDDIEQRLLGAVRERANVAYPRDLVERLAAQRIDALLRELDEGGHTLDEYLEQEKISLVDLEQEMLNQARGIIESQLLLTEVARKQEIRVTEAQLAEELGAEEGAATEEATQRAANRVMYRNIMNFLKENNEIVPVGAPAGGVSTPEGREEAEDHPEGERREGGLMSRLFRRKGHAEEAEPEEGATPEGTTEATAESEQ